MKQLDKLNNMTTAGSTAREVLETTPLIMRAVRGEMRSHRTPDLSIPQFRTLGFLHRQQGASLTEAAQHLGLRPPTMSKMIDTLVGRGLVARQTHPDDRRRVTLVLSEGGERLWQEARTATSAFLTDKLKGLPDEELTVIARAMESLRRLFQAGPGSEPKLPRS